MYFILLLFTYSITFLLDSIHNNFTFLYYSSNTTYLYVLWTVLINSFIFFKALYLLKKLNIKFNFYKLNCFIAYLLMLIGTLIPYQNGKQDILSTLHIVMPVLGTILTGIIIRYMIVHLSVFDLMMSQDLLLLYYHLLFILFTIMIIFGSINIIIELYIITFIFYFLCKIEKVCKGENLCKDVHGQI